MRTLGSCTLVLAALGVLSPATFAQTDGKSIALSPAMNGSWVTTTQPTAVGMNPMIQVGMPVAAVPDGSCQAGPACEKGESPDNDASPFSAWGEGLVLQSRGGDLIFAQPRQGFSTLSVPAGPQGILEPDYSAGVRVGFDYNLNDKNAAVEARFFGWQNQTHATLTATGTSVLFPSITLTNGIQNSSTTATSAAVSYGEELYMGDLSYIHTFYNSNSCLVRWVAGVSYAHTRDDLNGSFATQGTTTVDTRIQFDGIGPRLGLEALYTCNSNLHLYCRSYLDLLAGHYGASFNQANVFAGNQGNIDYKDDRFVPVVELELGATWTCCNGRVNISAGYDLMAFFNSVTTTDFISSVQNNNFTTSNCNLNATKTLDGLAARVEFKF